MKTAIFIWMRSSTGSVCLMRKKPGMESEGTTDLTFMRVSTRMTNLTVTVELSGLTAGSTLGSGKTTLTWAKVPRSVEMGRPEKDGGKETNSWVRKSQITGLEYLPVTHDF